MQTSQKHAPTQSPMIKKSPMSQAIRTALAVAIATSTLLPLAESATATTTFDTVQENVLTVCTSTAFPPVAYHQNDQLTGYDITFLSDFAASHNLKITFLVFAFDGLWWRPGRDECDIAASGISKREQRLSPGVGWSQPYYEVLRTLLIRAEDAQHLQGIKDFGNKTIGFIAGSTAEVDTRARAPSNARLIPYQSAQKGVSDLLAGQIDAFAEGTISSDHFRAQNPALSATPGHPMIDSDREFLQFPYRQASHIGPALNAWIKKNGTHYGR